MFRNLLRAPNALRVVTVILTIAAMLCVSAASLSAAHTHVNEPVGSCSVCYTAHQAAQQISVVQVIHAPELQSILAPSVSIQQIDSRGVLALLTRGPPSSL